MWPERHHLCRDQRMRGGLVVKQSQHRDLQGRAHHGVPSGFSQRVPQFDEVVNCLTYWVADQIADGASDVPERSVPGDPGVAVRIVGDPAAAEHDSRELILLGHVVEQMPLQIRAVVGRDGRRQAEDSGPDPVRHRTTLHRTNRHPSAKPRFRWQDAAEMHSTSTRWPGLPPTIRWRGRESPTWCCRGVPAPTPTRRRTRNAPAIRGPRVRVAQRASRN
jgi:hypothetical protein